MPRTTISKYPDGNVAAGASEATAVGDAPLPAGQTLKLSCFGGALQYAGRVEIQIRTQVTPTEKWRTMRAVVGPGDSHYDDFQPIVGDGVIAAVRILRTNNDASSRPIIAWAEGFKKRG